MVLQNLRPIRLSRRPEPFDSDDYLYELKIDGFRALARIADGKGELISRNGNTFRGFAELAAWIAEHVNVEDAVLDGEIACGAGFEVDRRVEQERPLWFHTVHHSRTAFHSRL